MTDPRLQLTFQELLFAATALRQQARWFEAQASDPQYGSTRTIFANSARAQDDLAAKIQRIADQIARRPTGHFRPR